MATSRRAPARRIAVLGASLPGTFAALTVASASNHKHPFTVDFYPFPNADLHAGFFGATPWASFVAAVGNEDLIEALQLFLQRSRDNGATEHLTLQSSAVRVCLEEPAIEGSPASDDDTTGEVRLAAAAQKVCEEQPERCAQAIVRALALVRAAKKAPAGQTLDHRLFHDQKDDEAAESQEKDLEDARMLLNGLQACLAPATGNAVTEGATVCLDVFEGTLEAMKPDLLIHGYQFRRHGMYVSLLDWMLTLCRTYGSALVVHNTLDERGNPAPAYCNVQTDGATGGANHRKDATLTVRHAGTATSADAVVLAVDTRTVEHLVSVNQAPLGRTRPALVGHLRGVASKRQLTTFVGRGGERSPFVTSLASPGALDRAVQRVGADIQAETEGGAAAPAQAGDKDDNPDVAAVAELLRSMRDGTRTLQQTTVLAAPGRCFSTWEIDNDTRLVTSDYAARAFHPRDACFLAQKKTTFDFPVRTVCLDDPRPENQTICQSLLYELGAQLSSRLYLTSATAVAQVASVAGMFRLGGAVARRVLNDQPQVDPPHPPPGGAKPRGTARRIGRSRRT